MIRYYSTNRRLEGVAGLTPFRGQVSFRDALIQGQAPDEGLFMPDTIPRLSVDEILALKGAPYAQAALLVAQSFLEGELPRDVLEQVVEDSYNYDVPLERVFDRMYVMRLDQGPTASFKDFAARMMARLMSRLRDRGKRLNVLVATSGDTGSAVGEAFKGVEGINVWILYPRNEVSGRQKKQLDTIGDNVQAMSVDGKFDDCQNLVKQAFSDRGAFAVQPDLGQLHQLRPDHAADRLLRLRLRPTGQEGRGDRLLRPLGEFRQCPGLRVRPTHGASRSGCSSCPPTKTTSSPTISGQASTRRSPRRGPASPTP